MSGIKQIYLRMHGIRKYFVLAVICVCIETFFEVIIPYLMSEIIDVGIIRKDVSIFYSAGLKMGVCALFSLLFGLAYAKCAAVASSRLAQNLRKDEFDKIQSFTFANIDHFEVSGLITRMTSDINVLQNAITSGIRPIARGPIMLVLGLFMSFLINAKMTLIFFFVSPLLIAILVFIVKKVAPKYTLLQKTVDSLNGIVQENLIAIRVVKAFVRKDYEEKRFEEINNELASLTQNTFHYALLNVPAFQLAMYSTIIALMMVGVSLIQQGSMQVGELTGILSYVLQILNSFVMMSNVFLLLTRSMASVNRIAEVFDQTSTIHSPENGKVMKDGSVQFKNVSFKYKEDGINNVLSRVNFFIESGSTVGIIGGTGSAKSTLVSLIDRLYDVNEGQVIVGGYNVKDLDLYQLRDDVGIVLQNNVLFSGTIEENLKWGNPNATHKDIERALKISCADEFIQRLPGGLDMELGQGGVNVSGGQKQRLCIARTLLKNPKIIIFDDSTSAVDTKTDAKIRAGLKSIEGLTQIIIAHRISSIENCDKIIILHEGKIHGIGTHQQLLACNNIYQEIYASQKKGEKDE